MTKESQKSREREKKYPVGFLKMVAIASGCSAEYVRMVLYKGFAKYKNNDYSQRNTEMVRRVRCKAKELEQFISPGA